MGGTQPGRALFSHSCYTTTSSYTAQTAATSYKKPSMTAPTLDQPCSSKILHSLLDSATDCRHLSSGVIWCVPDTAQPTQAAPSQCEPHPLTLRSTLRLSLAKVITPTHLKLKGKMHSARYLAAGLYRQKSPPLASDWSILMQMRAPNPHS